MAATPSYVNRPRSPVTHRRPMHVRVSPHMGVVAAVAGSRRRRLRYVTERRGFLATLLISPAVLFIAALVGVPLVLAIYLSFTDATAGSLSGKWVGLANFRAELHNPIFRGALWHTFLFTAISQAVVVVCAGLLAHALVRQFRGRWILRFFILLPWAAPIALTAIAIVAVLFGIVFTATDMVVPYILTNGGPFNSTQVLTTLAFQTGINAGNIGEGAAVALFMLPLLALVTVAMLFFARRAEVT